MDNADLNFLPATEAIKLIREKKLSPVELMSAILERIAALEPRVNAFSTFDFEMAMDQAKSAEALVAANNSHLDPLHGIPVTIKDLTSVLGLPFQRGSRIDADHVGTIDEPVVQRLKNSGAILLGKTTTSEFGWKGVSQSPLTGITHNPWKYGYNAGASSAGAGAAAAIGFGPLHHGGDGAGSIRMPAHFCGVFGFKPSFGRIPNVPMRVNDQISHAGPITRTVADAALMLEIMSGPHISDPYSLCSEWINNIELLNLDLKGLRIAFSPDLGHARVDPEVAALVKNAAKTFQELGAHVEETKTPWAGDGPELIRFFWKADSLLYRAYLDEWAEKMDPGLVACIRESGDPSYEEYLHMRKRKLDYITAMQDWFNNWDLLLTPSVSVTAFPANCLQPMHWPQDDWDWLMWAEFSYPFNFSHNPAASVPCGFTEDGLPVGLQIVGHRLDDLGVLRAAAAFERARPWAHKRPEIDANN